MCFWWSVVCQIRTQSLFYLLVREVGAVVPVVVVDDDDSIVVEEYPIDEVVHEIFPCTFVRFVKMKELLEPKLYLFFGEFLRILELFLGDSFLDEFLVFFEFLKFGLRGLRYNPSLDSREEVVYISAYLGELLLEENEFGKVSLFFLQGENLGCNIVNY